MTADASGQMKEIALNNKVTICRLEIHHGK